MYRHLRHLAPALVVVGLIAAHCRADEPTTLKYKWIKGQAVRYRVMLDQFCTTTTEGQVAVLGQSYTRILRMTPAEITPSGEATVEVITESIVVDTSGPKGKSHYDSTQPQPSTADAAQAMGVLVGEAYSLTFDPQGRVLRTAGLDELMVKVLKKVDTGKEDLVTKAFRVLLADNEVANVFEPGFRVLPERAVNPGDSWPVSSEVSLPSAPLRLSRNLTWTFERMDGGIAEQRMDGTLVQAPRKPDHPRDIAEVLFKLEAMNAKTSGQSRFDAALGQLVRTESSTAVASTASCGGLDGLTRMTTVQDTQTKLVIERLPEQPAATPSSSSSSTGGPAVPVVPRLDR